MNILLVNQAYYPDRVASAVYLTEFAEFLVSQGHEVTVLASRFGYDNHKEVFHMTETINGVRIIRAGAIVIYRGSRTARILNAFFMNMAFAWKLMMFKNFDHVIAMTSPPLVGFIALLFSRLKKSKFTYWLLDINPDQAIQAGWIRRKSVRTYLLQKILNFTLKGSDTIVVLDRYMKQKIVEKNIEPKKIQIHPLWPNAPHFREYQSQEQLKSKMGLSGKFVVLYAGNHSICHPLDTLLACAEHFKHDDSIAFVFVGRGARVEDVTRFKKDRGVASIYQFDFQDCWQETLYLADLHVVVMGDEYIGLVHPCKIYNILTTQRPFLYIGNSETHIADIIRCYNIGMQVSHCDNETAVKYISRLKDFPTQATKPYHNQSNPGQQVFNSMNIMSRMTSDLFNECV